LLFRIIEIPDDFNGPKNVMKLIKIKIVIVRELPLVLLLLLPLFFPSSSSSSAPAFLSIVYFSLLTLSFSF